MSLGDYVGLSQDGSAVRFLQADLFSARRFQTCTAATPASFCEPNSRDAQTAVILMSYVLNVNSEIENKRRNKYQ